MAKTVSDLMTEAGLMTQESPSFDNNLWTVDEVIGYINDGERDFFERTGIVKHSGDVDGVLGQRLYNLPDGGSSKVDRIAYERVRMYQAQEMELDLEDLNWRDKSGTPKQWHQDDLEIDEFEVDKKPLKTAAPFTFSQNFGAVRDWPSSTYTGESFGTVREINPFDEKNYPSAGSGTVRSATTEDGVFEVISNAVPSTRSSASENMNVPDAFFPAVKYYVLWKMLSKEGEGQDLRRAAYGRSRYMSYVSIALALTSGTELG